MYKYNYKHSTVVIRNRMHSKLPIIFSYKTHISQQLNWKKRTKFSKIFITLKLEMDAVEKKQVQKLQQTKATSLIFLSFGIWAKKSVTLKMSHELSKHHSCWSRNGSLGDPLGDPKYSETFVTEFSTRRCCQSTIQSQSVLAFQACFSFLPPPVYLATS